MDTEAPAPGKEGRVTRHEAGLGCSCRMATGQVVLAYRPQICMMGAVGEATERSRHPNAPI